MPVRKPAPQPQFDLFAAETSSTTRPAPVSQPPIPANDSPATPTRRDPRQVIIPSAQGVDEWWTTRMTCSFLKISRKTLWERRRDPLLNFPQPVQLGGARNLYRASAVRAWCEQMAAESSASNCMS